MNRCFALLILGIVALAQDPNCSHQSDCQTDECCVHSGVFGGDNLELLGRKRFIFTTHVGHCRPFRKMNETCLPFMAHDIFNHELYQSHCPCIKTLQCRGETVHEGPNGIQHFNPKCQTIESTHSTSTVGN